MRSSSFSSQLANPTQQFASRYRQSFAGAGTTGGTTFPNNREYGFFVQDDWRATPRLTVNLGLRYDYQQLPEPGSVQVNNVTFNGNPAYPLTTNFNQDKNNFGPRLGATYDFGGKHDTVLRFGYGVFYGLTTNSAIANALTNNAVSQASYSFTPTSM